MHPAKEVSFWHMFGQNPFGSQEPNCTEKLYAKKNKTYIYVLRIQLHISVYTYGRTGSNSPDKRSHCRGNV